MDPVLKQRLIGAGVVWVLAMIFLPMFLGGDRSRHDTRVELGLPAELQERRETRQVRLDEGDQSTPPPPVEEPVAEAPVVSEPPPEAEAAPEPQPEPVPEPVRESGEDEAAAADAGFVVQVGSFGLQENARGLAERLREHDYPVLVTEYRRNGDTLHRVRVGPVETREEADDIQENLQQRMGLSGKVISYP